MTTITKTPTSTSKKLAVTYSRLKAYELCPRKYFECDVLQKWPEEPSQHLQWGDAVHRAMATTLTTGIGLPASMRGYQKWIDKVHNTAGELLVEDEARLAINRDLQPCAWFGPQAWMRGIADVIKLDEERPGAALVVDWKTGKSGNVDEVQLIALSLMVFIHFPKIERVRSDFIFLSDDAQCTVVMDRKEVADHWAELMPRIKIFELAAETGHYPEKPNNLCKSWCRVRDCQFNGRR